MGVSHAVSLAIVVDANEDAKISRAQDLGFECVFGESSHGIRFAVLICANSTRKLVADNLNVYTEDEVLREWTQTPAFAETFSRLKEIFEELGDASPFAIDFCWSTWLDSRNVRSKQESLTECLETTSRSSKTCQTSRFQKSLQIETKPK